MQVRSAATPIAETPIVLSPVELALPPDNAPTERSSRPERTGSAVTSGPARRGGRHRTRAAPRPVALTRAEEYGFIRSDLHRLLITATLLGLAMIALLFVLEV